MNLELGILVMGFFASFLAGYSLSLTVSVGKVDWASVLSGAISVAVFFGFAQVMFS